MMRLLSDGCGSASASWVWRRHSADGDTFTVRIPTSVVSEMQWGNTVSGCLFKGRRRRGPVP